MTATEFLRILLAAKAARANETERAQLMELLRGQWQPDKVLEALQTKDPAR